MRARLGLTARWGPGAVIACGVAYSLALVAFVPGEVFFNGDAGLKALMTRQWARGQATLDLRLDAPAWVRTLWDEGLYPFGPPFVYRRGDAAVISFPLVFPLLAAPFYRIGGFRGLYVIPLVSLWATWLMVDRLNRRSRPDTAARARSLAALVFASPLTLYGAMFWEHTLAVAAVCASMALALPADGTPGRGRSFAAGMVLGGAAWIRPESFALMAVVTARVIVWPPRSHPRSVAIAGLLGMLSAVLAFAAVNVVVTGYPFGYHGRQVVHGLSTMQHVTTAFKLLVKLPLMFVAFFPSCVAMVATRLRSSPRIRPGRVLAAASLGALGMAVLVAIIPNDGGKQWGPRYLLPLLPLLVVGANRGTGVPRAMPGSIRLLAAACMALGVIHNTGVGTWRLIEDYRSRVHPALTELAGRPERVIAVSHQFVAQELEALLPARSMVLAAGTDDFRRLAKALDSEGITRFVYVCLANRVMTGEIPVETVRGRRRIVADEPARRGWFLVYPAEIRGSRAIGHERFLLTNMTG